MIEHQTENGVPRNLLALAKWAFGPNGLPNLRILTWGDFGFFGRWDAVNPLYCRNADCSDEDSNELSRTAHQQCPFRQLRKDDVELRALVRCHEDFLSACPGDSLMYE